MATLNTGIILHRLTLSPHITLKVLLGNVERERERREREREVERRGGDGVGRGTGCAEGQL